MSFSEYDGDLGKGSGFQFFDNLFYRVRYHLRESI
jgi:hypothetical protein